MLVHSDSTSLGEAGEQPGYGTEFVLPAVCPSLAGRERLRAENTVWPVVTARDILHAQHILRC
jgi:hypothetical protein